MDETGNTAGDQGTHHVIGRQGGADQENVTLIVTICADGSVLPPTVIFKAKKFLKKWGKNNNRWTDGELALEWLHNNFNANTKEKADGHTRVLILDGHSSHYTPAFLCYACLHVVCFARFKECWKEEVSTFENTYQQKVDKASFVEVLGTAFLKAFTPELIQSAFAATGIYPFNRNTISPQQMKPSEATSTKGSFPLPQTSPLVLSNQSSKLLHPSLPLTGVF
ncbi:hypothetical protein BS17DRAFT_797243 [Gyrodon lividus]|nr:hypothetical protein BS17DRAFT_797243 [Gyrodon lividus]